MRFEKWRMAGVCGVLLGLAAMSAGVAGQTAASPDVLTELLREVRGLRSAMEQIASSGPRVQLALGRLQLQEQRVNTLLRRLDEIRAALQQAQSDHEGHQQQMRQFETVIEEAGAQERKEATFMIEQLKAPVARAAADIQRLQLEEASTAQLLASEQARWTDINRSVEDLERTLLKR
jgi:chromosome segregation ATPase